MNGAGKNQPQSLFKISSGPMACHHEHMAAGDPIVFGFNDPAQAAGFTTQQKTSAPILPDPIGTYARLLTTDAVSTSASGTLTAWHLTPVDATSAAATRTLPAANSVTAGVETAVKKSDTSANTVTVQRAGSDLIFGTGSGSTSKALTLAGEAITFVSNGVDRWTIQTSDTPSGVLAAIYERKATPDSVSPVVQGVVADYTGRLGTAGTGTDNRSAIQTALNNASSVSGSNYYAYLNRKSTIVSLPPGDYYLSAPSGGASASLVIPAGVVFDFTKATLHCDYPDTATDNWCAIQVGQYGQVKVGKLYVRTGSTAPDSRDMYDGIRVVNTDNQSRVRGYHDTDITGFQGAAVRFVGAWISYAQGLRIGACSYGIVVSRSGSAFNYTVPAGGLALPRTNTDVFVDDCIIVNCAKGGILGLVKGDTGVQNDIAFGTGQLGNFLSIISTTIEQCGEFAVQWKAAQSFAWSHSRIEDCGSSGSSAVWLDSVRTATVEGMVLSLQGDVHPTASGTGTSFIANLFRLDNVGTFSLKGLFTTNTFKTGLVFASSAPTVGWFVTGIKNDGNDFAASGIYPGAGNTGMGGTWNSGHLVVGGLHAWKDTYDRLRISKDTPADDLDGMAFAGTGDMLTVGEETLDRVLGFTTRSAITANGDVRLTFFQARKTETISQIRVPTGGTAQVGATLIKLGVYEENRSTGDLTLVGQTANTLTLFGSTSTSTEYTTALTASFTKTRGKRYAYGVLVIGCSTTPTFGGYSPSSSLVLSRTPRRSGLVSSQTDLPSSITAASLSNLQAAYYAELLP